MTNNTAGLKDGEFICPTLLMCILWKTKMLCVHTIKRSHRAISGLAPYESFGTISPSRNENTNSLDAEVW